MRTTLDKANRFLAKAADAQAQGRPDKAIQYYRDAWMFAQKSL